MHRTSVKQQKSGHHEAAIAQNHADVHSTHAQVAHALPGAVRNLWQHILQTTHEGILSRYAAQFHLIFRVRAVDWIS